MRSIFTDVVPREYGSTAKEILIEKLSAKYGDGGEAEVRASELLAVGGKKVLDCIKKDLKNRYSLLEDWLLPPVNQNLPAYDDEWLSIAPLGDGTSLVLVYAYTSDKKHDHCDGATFFPDNVRGVLPGALFHDIWYERMESIAKAWGWKVSKVRKLGDQIFASIMIEEKANAFVTGFCYWTTRSFGGIFHGIMKIKWIKKLLGVFALGSLLMFSGCVTSVFVDTPDAPYVHPVFESSK